MNGLLINIQKEIAKKVSVKDFLKVKKLDRGHYNGVKVPICKKEYKRKKRLSRLKSENKFWEFIVTFKDKPIDWYEISANKNITMDIVEKNPNLPWSYSGLSGNPNVTTEFINKNSTANWNYYELLKTLCAHEIKQIPINLPNPQIRLVNNNQTMEFIIKTQPYIEKGNVIIASYSCSKNITISDILKNPQIFWDMQAVATRNDLTNEIIADFPHLDWYYPQLSISKCITFSLVDQLPDKAWDWQRVLNKVDSLKFIEKYFHKWTDLPLFTMENGKLQLKEDSVFKKDVRRASNSFNKKILEDLFDLTDISVVKKISLLRYMKLKKIENFLTTHPMTDKVVKAIELNSNMTLDFIEKYPEIDWDWHNIAHYNRKIITRKISTVFLTKQPYNRIWRDMGTYIDINFIGENPQLPWNWGDISTHPDLTMEFVKKHKKFYNWFLLSKNPGIKITDILENLSYPWNWANITEYREDLTIEILLANPNLPIEWEHIHKNKKIFQKPKLFLLND